MTMLLITDICMTQVHTTYLSIVSPQAAVCKLQIAGCKNRNPGGSNQVNHMNFYDAVYS